MKPFEYHRAKSVAEAVGLLAKHKENSALLAGGTDLLGLRKDGVEGPSLRAPEHLVALKGIPELGTLRETKDGLRIGAAVTVAEIAGSPTIAKRYPQLSQAAGQVAVPQIRNVATVAGNLCQRPRCWYFRGSLFRECYRKGGGQCFAPDGENQYHAVFGADSCHMVYPSDLAPALIASGAKAEIAGPKGQRILPLEKFYLSPKEDILRENVLNPGEMVVAVTVPPASPSAVGVYVKLKEREAFDFALVSLAVAGTSASGRLSDCRVVFGGLAPFPLRATKVEAALQGNRPAEVAALATTVLTHGSRPLSKNAYKVDAAVGVLQKALSALG